MEKPHTAGSDTAISLGLDVLRDGMQLMRRFLWRGILYSAVVELVTVVASTPLIMWAFYQVLKLSGEPVRLNVDILDLLLSPRVLLGLLWLPVLAWTALLSVGGLAILAAASHRGHWLSLRSAFTQVFRRLPLVRGVAIVKAVLFFVVALPALGAVAASLISGTLLSIPESALFEIIPYSTTLGVAIALAVAAGTILVLWLTTRWCFVTFGVGVEGLALGQAFRRSVQMGYGYRWQILWLIVSASLVVAVAFTLGAGLLGMCTGLFVRSTIGMSELTFASLAALVVTLDIAFLSLLVWVCGIWLTAVTAVAYFRLRSDSSNVPDPEPPLGFLVPDSARSSARSRLLVPGLFVVVVSAFTVPEVLRVIGGLDREVAITAHRGSAIRRPENTLAAVRAAIEDGADFIEIDVQQAADGRLILLHDTTLLRTTGRPEGAWELTSEALAALDAGSWFGAEFAGETIPTLAAAIQAARGNCFLNIELKLHGRERELAKTLVTLLEDEEFMDDCVVTSLDQSVLADVRRAAPTLRVGMIITALIGNADALDVDILAVQPLIATPGFIARAHRRQREVHVWSLNEARNMNTVIDRGADGILTPDPALARRVLNARTPADDVRALLVRLFGRPGRMAPAPTGWE